MNTQQTPHVSQQKTLSQMLYPRENWIAKMWMATIFALSSRPRMLLETPIRKNLGERYFNFSSCLFLALALAAFPVFDASRSDRFDNDEGRFSLLLFLLHYLTWYAYLLVFVYSAFERRDEVRHLPGVFDFKRHSMSQGYLHPFFRNMTIKGEKADRRIISIWLEPGLFFIGGVLLWILQQPLGLLFIGCSVIYSLSYQSAYDQANDLLMNKIDELLVAEEIANILIDGKEAEETRGVTFLGDRPENIELRRQLADVLTGKTDLYAVVAGGANGTRFERSNAVHREEV